jgi:hypothetical protein
MTKRLSALLLLISLPALASGQGVPADRTEIIAAVQGFFDSMAKRDPEIARRVLMPEARLHSVSDQSGAPVARASTAEAFIAGLTTGQGTLLERMWDPEIRIEGAIATLWTRYDFHRNGTFSHCGVDAFDLIKTPQGWRIAGAMYTIQRTGCAASPLGPPK